MPIEIKELHIKVTVDASPPSNPERTAAVKPQSNGHADKDAFIAECVEQVLQILQNKKER